MTHITKTRLWLLTAILILTVASIASVKLIKQSANAYVFGYPLVLMELTRKSMTADSPANARSNSLAHMRAFPDHNFRQVVRPNDDTLYSVAWFDLTKEPMIISTPASDRYYVLPFMNAWTDVFATVGTNSTGNQATNAVLVGPDWKGALPDGPNVIKAPTNMVWMIGRIQTNGKDDIPNVAAFQDQMSITPLSQWPQGKPNARSIIENFDDIDTRNNPKAQIDALSADDFFNMLSTLMAKQPAREHDQLAIENLAKIGVNPGWRVDVNAIQKHLIQLGVSLANDKMHEAIDSQSASPVENGWIMWRDTIGQTGTHYNIRAGVAMAGLGALPISEAAYASTSIDNKNQILKGKNQYKIHFPAGQIPPAKAFWSLTLYDVDGFMVQTELNRYLLGSRDPLIFNTDGSLDLHIAHTQPTTAESNWLPAPKDQFTLMLRMYSLDKNFYDGSWKIPFVERIN